MDESIVMHFEQPVVAPKKLSELIRDGAKLRPQGKIYTERMVIRGESCALLAAAEAITGTLIPCTHECMKIISGYCGIQQEDLFPIMFMNDDGHTREQCADYAEAHGY